MSIIPASSERRRIFDDIRQGYEFVAARAASVTIHRDRLAAYARALPAVPPDRLFDAAHHYDGGSYEDMAAYVFALDAINFGSGYEPHLVAEGWGLIDHSLYFTISTRLKHYFEHNGPLRVAMMAKIKPDDVAKILMLGQGPFSREFAALCAQSLNEMGSFVLSGYGGRFVSVIEAAEGSAEQFVAALTVLSHFQDVHSYQGRRISFYKRAQIMAADLNLAFWRRGFEIFRDMGSLTMFPDNGVPHVLHTDGVLTYSESLAGRIRAGIEIASGSSEEIELRACAAHAVELIAAAKGMRAVDIDHILWHRSAEDPRYMAFPAHRTLSIYY